MNASRSIWSIFAAGLILGWQLPGCCSPKSSDIAITSVSVVGVIPFSAIKENLKPKFTISGDAAKNEAARVTASQSTRSLNAVTGEVTAGIDVGAEGSAPG